MSIYGVGISAYSATGYGYTRTGQTTASRNHTNCTETVQKSEMAGGSFVLHYFDNEDGEKTVGAACGTDYSISAYIPKDFDPENPVYKVKVWDKDGEVMERMVDVSKVDPENSDYIDMFAYASYLESSGKCPGAQSAFMGSSGNPYDMGDRRYDDLFEKTNWMGKLKEFMQMQYDAGNLMGYMEYKKFYDFLGTDNAMESSGVSGQNRISGEEKASVQYQRTVERSETSNERTDGQNMTVFYNGIPLEERKNTDKKYTDPETGISFYVADGKHPYMAGEDVEKLKKLCAETGEPFLKKMAEITGVIRHLDNNTTVYIADNGAVIKSKDGRELSIDTSSLSYDVLSYMFQNLGGTKEYFNEAYWNARMRDAVGNYLTADHS